MNKYISTLRIIIMKRMCKFIVVIILLASVMFATDFIRAKRNKKPVFAMEAGFYSDGGTREYLGLGYKVIAYAVLDEGLTDEVICKIGTWFLSYDNDFPR